MMLDILITSNVTVYVCKHRLHLHRRTRTKRDISYHVCLRPTPLPPIQLANCV